MSQTPYTGRTDWTDTDRYEFIVGRLESMVVELNTSLGLDPHDPDGLRVSFGYIGNLAVGAQPGGRGDDRTWSVFLPHPGRVGTDADQIGSFKTGDLAGAQATLNALYGFQRGLRWANGPEMTEIRYRRSGRIATD